MEFKSFLDYLSLEKKYSSKTIIAYKNDLQSFSTFNKSEFDQNCIQEAVYTQIRSWIVLLVGKKISNSRANGLNNMIKKIKFYAIAFSKNS